MGEVVFIRRYNVGKVEAANDVFKKTLKDSKGIRPELCPSIRDYHSTGWMISTPVNVHFQGEREFKVNKYIDENKKKFLVPGVIGDRDSKKLYARIDTGFSLENLSVPMMALKCQYENDFFGNFEIAPVVYPKQYTGPILIAAYGKNCFELAADQFILHLMPLSETVMTHRIEDNFMHPEVRFEGLLRDGWEGKCTHAGEFSSEDIIRQ
jgi:hypothetical protein